MQLSMLEIQQYINIHPIISKKEGLRYKYLVLLKYFIDKLENDDIWTTQTLKLYYKKFINVDLENKFVKDFNFFEKFKFFQYRYFLLLDCLFIGCFDNRSNGERLVEDFIGFYGQRYKKKLNIVFEAFYDIQDNGVIKKIPDLKMIYEIIWENRKFLKRENKKIMITANMSAGKSTLLNALTGKKINKTQNDTCTSKIHFIHNKSGEDHLNYEWDHDLELDATTDILMNDNSENDSSEIHVGTRFRSIDDIKERVCFIDTPGVNSSMDRNHRIISNDAIRNISCDVLIYMFNGENIGSDDDLKHLKYVKENYGGKILFLINRLDRFKKGTDSVIQTLESAKKDLCKIGFEKPEVYPISAYAAYLAKMMLYEEILSEDELDDLEFVKRKLKNEEFSYERYFPDSIAGEKITDDDIGELLLHSGILSLEKMIYAKKGE